MAKNILLFKLPVNRRSADSIKAKIAEIYVLIDDAFEVFIREMDPSSDAMQEFRKNAFNNFIRRTISIPDILMSMNEASQNLL
jgi:hypothetical protein